MEVIIPNLHWRYSGVTAANRAMAPRIARLTRAAWLGRDAPAGIDRLSFGDLLRLRGLSRGGRRLIWHARRNNEMIAGLVLKWLGWPLALLFTSSAQRRHSWLTRFLIARMDGVIATSEAAASYLERPAAVVLHGVDTMLYAPPADRMRAFMQSGLPGRYAIGCFGRVRAQKGTDLFVAAMCRLLPSYPDFSAVVIGRVSAEHRAYASELEGRVRDAGLSDRVRFLGELPIEEVPRWYQRISVYAFTSRNEGFGLTMLEAMSAGCALVATREGAAEAVVVDGASGVLIPSDDVDALVAAIEPLLRDPAKAAAMGVQARNRAIDLFSAEREAQQIVAVYRDVWAGRPARTLRTSA